MKKCILKAFCLICLSGAIFSQAQKSFNGARVSVLPPTVKNINEVALSDMVAKKIESNFSTYTDFTLIASNVAEIRSIQRQSEDLSFDERTAIEAGKLLSVQYVLFSGIAKIGSEYSFSCSFTNVTTGETKSFGPFNRKTINELYSIPGSAVDEMTIKLCESLGILLTNSQKYVLTHGEADLSASDQRKFNQENMDNYKRQLEELDSQINALKFSTDYEVKQRLEAERALAQEKFNAAKNKEQRLLEDERKRAEDEKQDAERNEEQKKKRNKMEKEAEEKIRQLREKRMENATILQQLSMIESKKKALVEIREDVEALVAESNDALKNERDDKRQRIQDAPYRAAQLDKDGNPTDKARANKERELQKIKDDYNGNGKTKGKIKEAEEKIRSATIRQENDLYYEILSDYGKIKKTQTLTSASENADLRYSVGIYDGSTYSWQAQLFVYSDGILLWQYDIPLSYKKLTGKDPDPDDDEKIEEYYDLVDLYISWFMRDSPILTFELDYNIEAYPDDTPSTYRFNFTKIRIKDTVSEKLVDNINLKNTSIERTMTPVYDIRTLEEQKIEKQKQELKAQQEQQALEEKLQREQQEKEEKLQREIYAQARKKYLRKKIDERSEKNMRIMGMGVDPYSTSGGFEGFDVDFNLTFKKDDSNTAKGYMGMTLGMVQTPDVIKDVIDPPYMFEFVTSLGFILHSTFRYSPNFYMQGGIGLVAAKTRGTWIYHYTSKDDAGNKKEKEEERKSASYLLTKFTVGLDFPLAKRFGLYAQGTLNLIKTDRDEKPIAPTFSAQAGFSIF